MIFKEKYLEIKQINEKYYITPISGWSMIIKACYCKAKTKWGLNRCIKYWEKQGYKVEK